MICLLATEIKLRLGTKSDERVLSASADQLICEHQLAVVALFLVSKKDVNLKDKIKGMICIQVFSDKTFFRCRSILIQEQV